MDVRPFESGGWFPIHNVVIDVIMPEVSPNGFKVLMAAIRQTWGWVADPDGNPKVRKNSDVISYSQFKKKTGIGSYSTLGAALKECLEKKYLVRHQVGVSQGFKKPIYAYTLNVDLEIATESVATSPTTEAVASLATETVVGLATETVVTKQRNKYQTYDDDAASLSVKQQEALSSLRDLGVNGALALVQQNEPENVIGWIKFAKSKAAIRDKAAFVASMLRRGEKPPRSYTETPQERAERERRERHERYTTGKYAYLYVT